jgi:cytochrome c oxidase accessory protein FixG
MNQIPVKDVTPKAGSGKAVVETYDLYAKREHIYVKFYKGLYRNLRTVSGFIMLAAFFGFSWLQWDGHQAVLFDLPNRQFHIFGMTFWPQDFMLLSWLLIILAFVLFLVTAVAGRLWCGYACPQFVWTWFFIWAERITEGDRNQRMKRDKAPLSTDKFARKAAKHLLWIVIAVATSLAFVGYFSPIRELIPSVLSWNLGPWETWWLGFFTLATYGNAGWLREQVCIYMCPYARFQSVMFDQDTLVISYDEKRGEHRGKRKKNVDYRAQGLGDCIDCGNCVHVCPVGIDIRDGLQYECVACGACIDACDDVMDRMGYEPGLIRYTTEHSLEGKPTHLLRPRLLAYTLTLAAMLVAFVYTIATRVPLEVDVLRDRGPLFTNTADGKLENSYTLKLANKDQQDHRFKISVSGIDGLDGLELVTASELSISAGELVDVALRLQVDPKYLQRSNYDILFQVEAVDDPAIRLDAESRFLGPAPRR